MVRLPGDRERGLMEPVKQRSVDVEALNGDFRGTVVAPGEQGWDEARAAWNLVADQHPAAVVYTETADDVSASGGLYFNFADRPAGLEELFDPDTLARLRDVKRRYDPDDLMCANHS